MYTHNTELMGKVTGRVAEPKIYDIALDDMRPATQVDIDRLAKIEQMYGALVMALRAISAPRDVGALFDADKRLAYLRSVEGAANEPRG